MTQCRVVHVLTICGAKPEIIAVSISESYLAHSDAEGIFLIILAIVGLIAVVLVSIAIHNSN